MSTRVAIALIGLLASPNGAAASAPSGDATTDKRPVRARLVADVDAAAVGEEFSVGALFDIEPGWHIYWTYPGNTGKPTRVSFTSDERHTKVLEPAFPSPAVFDPEPIEDLSFGYAGSVLVPANAMVFDLPPGGSSGIHASLSWLACKTTCVSGKAEVHLTLPVEDKPRPSPWADRFKHARDLIPKSLPEGQAWLKSLAFEDGTYHLCFELPGMKKVDHFIPHWLAGASCKVVSFGVLHEEGANPCVRMELTGDNCLPTAGGIAIGRPADAPVDSPARAFEVNARAPTRAVSAATTGPPDVGPAVRAAEGGVEDSLFWMLLFAFLGGMLLNIMPCVIPVVVPKILHVVRTAQKAEDPKERRRLLWSNALAYTGGVVGTMLSLALVVVVLKSIGHEVGWGFQFQNPWFLVFMISLLMVAGLGMLKTFSLKRSCQVDDLKQLRKVRRRSPLLESFFTGLLVTFLGTPCTAPLLGPALGYAFTAPTWTVVVFLGVVGLGLAAPFLLLGAWTGWARILPTRVTERYDRIMRFMAFLLFGTMVWLLGVLADAWGVEAAVNMLWVLLALGLASWIFGLLTCDTDPWKRRIVRLLPLLAAVVAFGAWVLEFPRDASAKPHMLHSKVGIDWKPFTEQEVQRLRASGKSVFIDFTAGWCMNCKANERLFIETKASKALFDELDMVTFKADHTRFDPVIHKWLKQFGRAGVPMYVIFPACRPDGEAILLPEILTSGILHDALRRAGASKKSCK